MLAMNEHEGVLYYRTVFSEVYDVVAVFHGDGRLGQILDQFLINDRVMGQDSILECKHRETGSLRKSDLHMKHICHKVIYNKKGKKEKDQWSFQYDSLTEEMHQNASIEKLLRHTHHFSSVK